MCIRDRLDTNIKAHNFIPAEYWKSNFKSVKEALLLAEVYVYVVSYTHLDVYKRQAGVSHTATETTGTLSNT